MPITKLWQGVNTDNFVGLSEIPKKEPNDQAQIVPLDIKGGGANDLFTVKKVANTYSQAFYYSHISIK